MKLLIMQFSPVSRHFFLLRLEYLPQHRIHKHTQPLLFSVFEKLLRELSTVIVCRRAMDGLVTEQPMFCVALCNPVSLYLPAVQTSELSCPTPSPQFFSYFLSCAGLGPTQNNRTVAAVSCQPSKRKYNQTHCRPR
jgi:hypothetical protein